MTDDMHPADRAEYERRLVEHGFYFEVRTRLKTPLQVPTPELPRITAPFRIEKCPGDEQVFMNGELIGVIDRGVFRPMLGPSRLEWIEITVER